MRNLMRLGAGLAVVILSIYACNLSNNAAEESPAALAFETTVLGLTKGATNGATVFNSTGQTINYSYTVTNNGTTALTGPVIVTDNKTTVTCPDVTAVGNKNATLDPQESITCTSTYIIAHADLIAGAVINNASATIGAVTSNTATATVNMTVSKVLAITTAANPINYSQAGQNITFTYSIKNTGPTPLGPAQFIVADERIPNPIPCGALDKTLASNETLTCTGTYATTQNDLTAGSVVSRATASGGGAISIEPATVTVNSLGAGGPNTNFTKGSTIQHQVKAGEWMLQISRCYGADVNAVWRANPSILDPDIIEIDYMMVVPNLGSNGTIYGPPCVVPYTVVSGDTWESIASKHNADVAVLREANKDKSLTAGVVLKIPINSAGFSAVTPQPPQQNDTVRVTFPSGSTTVTLNGTVTAQGSVRYVINATNGQTLGVKVTGPANELALGITSPVNAVLKQRDGVLNWNGLITANGDHTIEVAGASGANAKQFTLEVSLTSPTTNSPVERVADINQGAGDSSPSYLAVYNGALYFRADGNDNAGGELWKFDGTTKQVSRVWDVNPGTGGSEPAFLKEYTGALYFKANGNDGAGAELWRYNGSAAGRLNDMNNGAGDFNPSHMTVFNENLYFSANGNDGAGIELWRTDGNTITRVADIYSGSSDSSPSYLTVFSGALYFSALTNDGGVELWKYDGTNPPSRVWDINPGAGNSSPAHLAVFNNALYFSATSGDNAGVELWKYDGTTVTRAADVNPSGDSAPSFMTVFNSALYFSALGDATGFELWKFDGTNATRVTDLNKSGDTNPFYLTVYNNELYFQANGGDGAGKELWKFKGP